MPPFELAVFSAQGVTVHPLAPGKPLVVGRGDDADIRINDDALSRRHAVFHPGPPVEVEDLGSANGTHVCPATSPEPGAPTGDQRRIAATTRVRLGPGDSVFFGAAVVVVRKAPVSSEPRDYDADTDAVVRDPASRRLYDEAARVAQTSIPVLLLGETGAGKDLLARFIHQRSTRASRPFVALNCAAISETLAESQLFGHERGAFTGAAQARSGVFETAAGGTVFLDEIGELSPPTQAKLLRTLESGEVERLGSTKPVRVDVRIVAATNRDLEHAALLGTFRKDLYFRVSGATLRVPPLRERRSEIGAIAVKLLEAAAKQVGREAPGLSPAAVRALEAYSWPGNVRELRWVMERALVDVGSEPLGPEHLPPQVTAGERPASSAELLTSERLVEALRASHGNQTRAAELLGVSRRTLINRMIEYGLPRPRKV